MEHRCHTPEYCCLSPSECEDNARAAAQPLNVRKLGSEVAMTRAQLYRRLFAALDAAHGEARSSSARTSILEARRLSVELMHDEPDASLARDTSAREEVMP